MAKRPFEQFLSPFTRKLRRLIRFRMQIDEANSSHGKFIARYTPSRVILGYYVIKIKGK